MDDAIKNPLINDILTRTGGGGIGTFIVTQNNYITVGKEQPAQMPPYLRKEETIDLYRFLIDGGYIDPKTSSEDFLYVMGVTPVAPVKLSRINWLKTVQQLRVMLKMAYKEPLSRQSLRFAEIERRAPSCFRIKGRDMKQLAKDTVEISTDMDRLMEYFRPK